MPKQLNDRELKAEILEELEWTIKDLEKSENVPEWTVYYDHMSARNWSNSHFETAGQILFDEWPEIYDRRYRGKDDIEALRDYMPGYASGHMASVVMATPKLADDLPDREYREYKKLAEEWTDRFAPSRDRGRGRSRGPSGGGYSGGRDDDRDRNRSRRDERGGRDRPRGDRRDNRRTEDAGTSSTSQWGHIAAEDNRQREEQGRDRNREREESARQDRREPEYEHPARDPGGIDYTQREPHVRYTLNGSVFELAVASKLAPKRERNEDGIAMPAPLYDPRNSVHYYVEHPDRTVTEEIIAMPEDAKYLLHKTLNNPEPYMGSDGASDGILRRSNKGEPITEEAKPARVDNILTVVKDAVLGEGSVEIVSESVQALVNMARVELSKRDVPNFIQSGILRTAFPIKGDAEKNHAILAELTNAPTLTAAAEILSANRDVMDPGLFGYVNGELSTMLARAIRYQFQSGHMRKFNFADHWIEKVLPYVASKEGAEMVSNINSRCQGLIKMAVARCANDPDSLLEWGDTLFANEEEAAKFKGVLMLKHAFVIAVDRTMDEIGLGKILQPAEALSPNDLGVGSITSGNSDIINVQLRATYDSIIATSDLNAKQANLTAIQVVTSDNQTFHVIPYAAGRNHYVFFQQH